jgi:glutamyl-tRNA synthetase
MAHVPLIHGPDGTKLSKRHGAMGIDAYRAMGYLPEAMRNYLARLSWSHGDDEIMSTDEMIAWFDIDGIGKSAARFDFAKLESLNAHYIRSAADDRLMAIFLEALPHLPGGSDFVVQLTPERKAVLRAALPLLKERAKTLNALLDGARFLFAKRPLAMEAAAQSLIDPEARQTLADLGALLEAVPDWRTEPLEGAVKAFAAEKGVKLGKVAQPLRAALTGRAASPGIFDVLMLLGREESLARIADQASTPS